MHRDYRSTFIPSEPIRASRVVGDEETSFRNWDRKEAMQRVSKRQFNSQRTANSQEEIGECVSDGMVDRSMSECVSVRCIAAERANGTVCHALVHAGPYGTVP